MYEAGRRREGQAAFLSTPCTNRSMDSIQELLTAPCDGDSNKIEPKFIIRSGKNLNLIPSKAISKSD